MLTRDGALVLPDNREVPSLLAIARGLGRMPRFAGQTQGWWSVLHHSMAVTVMASPGGAEKLGLSFPPDVPAAAVELIAALHDAHEAITGDVPTTWKTQDLRRAQEVLDDRLFAAWGLTPYRTPAVLQHVQTVDRLALAAEAAACGPSGFFAAEPALPAPDPELVEFVRLLQATYGPRASIEDEGALVLKFVKGCNFRFAALRLPRPSALPSHQIPRDVRSPR